MPTQATQITSSTDSAKRSARTGVQSGISTALLVSAWNLFSGHPLSTEQSAVLTTIGAALPATVAYLMNMLEDAGMPAILKGKPEDTTARMLTTLAAEVGRLADALEARGLVEPKVFTEQVEPTLPGRPAVGVDRPGRDHHD